MYPESISTCICSAEPAELVDEPSEQETLVRLVTKEYFPSLTEDALPDAVQSFEELPLEPVSDDPVSKTLASVT
jgi:hypothetical protein